MCKLLILMEDHAWVLNKDVILEHFVLLYMDILYMGEIQAYGMNYLDYTLDCMLGAFSVI